MELRPTPITQNMPQIGGKTNKQKLSGGLMVPRYGRRIPSVSKAAAVVLLTLGHRRRSQRRFDWPDCWLWNLDDM